MEVAQMAKSGRTVGKVLWERDLGILQSVRPVLSICATLGGEVRISLFSQDLSFSGFRIQS